MRVGDFKRLGGLTVGLWCVNPENREAVFQVSNGKVSFSSTRKHGEHFETEKGALYRVTVLDSGYVGIKKDWRRA